MPALDDVIVFSGNENFYATEKARAELAALRRVADIARNPYLYSNNRWERAVTQDALETALQKLDEITKG